MSKIICSICNEEVNTLIHESEIKYYIYFVCKNCYKN